MTSLMCWVGADSRGLSSAYITTDSRISWGDKGQKAWDYGRKTFASIASPDIFGYCGDVVFPSLVLSQFVSALDAGVCHGDFATRFDALDQVVRVSFEKLPLTEQRTFQIVHCGRDGEGMSSSFRASVLSWTGTEFKRVHPVPATRSGAIWLAGSGSASINVEIARWQNRPPGGTTRALFRAFVDAIGSAADPKSGGAPQMAGLYRIGNGRSVGAVVGSRRFLNGMPVHDVAPGCEVAWHNEFFERASGTTRRRLPGSQKHGDVAQPAESDLCRFNA